MLRRRRGFECSANGRRRTTAAPLLLLCTWPALGVGIVGCAGEGPDPEAPAGESVALPDATSRPAAPFEDMAGELNPGGGSVVGGRVTATSEGGAVTVVIEASELPDPREYAAYLYRGTCAESTSETMTLNPIVTRPDRTGSSTTMVAPSLLAGDDPVSVRIFEPDGMAMACGELFPVASSTRGRPSAP